MGEFSNQYEELGQLIDSLDNLAHATTLSITPELHIEALRMALPEKVIAFKKVFFAITGEDPWEFRDSFKP